MSRNGNVIEKHWVKIITDNLKIDMYLIGIIKAYAKPYVFSRCVKMPEQVIKYIPLDMKPNYRKIYDQAVTDCYIELKDRHVFFTSGKWIKLLQLCSGIIQQDRLDSHKLETIKEIVSSIVDDLNDQVLIWVTFIEEAKWIHDSIPDSKLVIGGVSHGDQIIKDFKENKFKVLIAMPACIGAGISLENCRFQIFSSISPSNVLAEQSITRTNRINQKRQEIIYKVYYKNSVQELLYKSLDKKRKIQEDILEYMKNIIDK